MASFNKVILMGNLTRDPELSYTPQGVAVCKLGLAVNRSYTTASGEKKEDPLFVDIVVWKKQGENCATYLKKGSSALIEGELRLDKWQSKTGEKRTKIKVVANRVQFIGGKPPSQGASSGDMPQEEGGFPSEPHTESVPEEGVDEDIPF